MTSEHQQIVIGSLLNNADQLTKKVISAYSPDVKYQTNLLNLKKFNADHIEAAAVFLGLKVRADNKKLYKNLEILCDRIILRIESLFESLCTDCGETYSNSLTDIPPLSCHLCMQGSHDCSKVKEKIDSASRPPAGSVWLCSGCWRKNDLALVPAVTDVKTKAGETPELENNSETSESEVKESDIREDKKDRVSPRRNRESDFDQGVPICEAYKKRECRHGLTGKRLIDNQPCPHRHPPQCFRWQKHGDNKKLGCTKGDGCRYFHPKLCRSSVLRRECRNDECKFVHLKHTRRFKKPRNDTRPTAAERKPPLPPNTHQRIHFNSISTTDSPYAPTIQKRRQSNPTVPSYNSAGDKDLDSKSFLYKLMENMKQGILLKMSENLTELQKSIPDIVRQQIAMNRPPVLSCQPSQPQSRHQQMSFFPTAPHHPQANFQTQYAGCSY